MSYWDSALDDFLRSASAAAQQAKQTLAQASRTLLFGVDEIEAIYIL